MSGGKHIDKMNFIEKAAKLFDIPVNVLPWGMDIEIKNDRDVYIDGCESISEYTEERIVFRGKRMQVITEGENFELFTFADGRVRVSGKINAVTLVREG